MTVLPGTVCLQQQLSMLQPLLCVLHHMLQVSGQLRPGVGQYRFMHALLSRGAAELEALCPGYLQQLQVRGCSA
jgi:hypothetical protein